MSAAFNVDALTAAELDRLADRLAYRADQRKAEREAAERERRNPTPLRPHIGNGGIGFANDLARRKWDVQCIEALGCQTVPFAIAPGTSVVARDGSRLVAGLELKPYQHLNALNGDPIVQTQRLVEQGFVLEKVSQ